MDLNNLAQNPEQIKQLIALLQTLLPGENSEGQTSPPKRDEHITTSTKAEEPISNSPRRINKFVDMPEKNMHKEDCVIDQMLCKTPPVSRSRDFTPVQVKCRICGREESVSPSSLTSDSRSRYKCNRCSSSAG